MVIAHGHSWDRAGSAKYALMFLDMGWDAVIYDHRSCGFSDLRTLLALRLRADFRLPAFPFLPVAELIMRARLGSRWRGMESCAGISCDPLDRSSVQLHGRILAVLPTRVGGTPPEE